METTIIIGFLFWWLFWWAVYTVSFFLVDYRMRKTPWIILANIVQAFFFAAAPMGAIVKAFDREAPRLERGVNLVYLILTVFPAAIIALVALVIVPLMSL